jgi:hypothetical protein
LHPTPLRGPKIVAILTADSLPILISIYRCGAGEAQGVGRLIQQQMPFLTVFSLACAKDL